MSGLADLLGPSCAAALGWGVWRWCRRFPGLPNAVVVIALAGMVGSGVWMFVLALLGVGWPAWLLVPPALLGVIVGVTLRRPPVAVSRSRWPWVVAAAGPALGHGFLLLFRPATGWDFRYLWGLKAKVFAFAGSHDVAWLSWPPNVWHHPAYPPLWPDLIAMGIRLGGSAEGVTAVWNAILVVALAAACWDNVRDAALPLRLAAAAVGAFAPAVLSTPNSGYADLPVAFLAAATLGSLTRLRRDSIADTATEFTLAAAIAGLCLVKEEGMVLALGASVAAVWVGSRRTRAVAAVSFVLPVAAWQLVLWAIGVHRDPRSFDLRTWVASGQTLIAWLGAHVFSTTGALLVTWVLACVALLRRRASPIGVALLVWWCGLLAAYLTSLDPAPWHLTTSFDRVIAVPLPAVASVALGLDCPADAFPSVASPDR